jgi:hypothetical protein
MGYGVIAVDTVLLAQLLKLPEGAQVEETPHDALAAVLALPDSYHVVGMAQDFARRCHLIGVESAELPETPIGAQAPALEPIYVRESVMGDDGLLHSTVRILSLTMFTPPPDPWPVVS